MALSGAPHFELSIVLGNCKQSKISQEKKVIVYVS